MRAELSALHLKYLETLKIFLSTRKNACFIILHSLSLCAGKEERKNIKGHKENSFSPFETWHG